MRVIALAVAFAALVHPSPAFADRTLRDPLLSPYFAQRVPPVPAPFLLPAPAHHGLDLRIDGLAGRIAPDQKGRTAAMVSITRLSGDLSLIPRRLSLGVLYPFASALPPDGGLAAGEPGRSAGQQLLSGNIESQLRAIFPLPTSLEIGFELAVAAPTASTGRDRASKSAAFAASSLDPTNITLFLPARTALRPSGDLRIVRGRLVLQGRHGLDIMIDGAGIDSAKVAGRLYAHAGWLLSPDVEVSLEASQLYFFASEQKVDGTQSFVQAFADTYRITDANRSALTIGPGVRWSSSEVDLGASLMTSIGDPLSPAALSFIGMRVSIIGHVATTRRERDR